MDQSTGIALSSLHGLVDWLNANVQTDAPFNQVWGWNLPSVTKADLIKRVSETISRLEITTQGDISPSQRNELEVTPSRILYLQTNSLPNINSPHSAQVVPQIFDELGRLDRAFPFPSPPPVPFPDWVQLAEAGYLPRRLVARFRGMESRLDRLSPDMDQLEHQMAVIRDAYQSAEQLPETQASLASAVKEVSDLRTQAQSYASDAASHSRDAGTATESIQNLTEAAEEKFADLDNAYRAAATKGLASSFQTKAIALEKSVRWWVGALAADLATGAAIGYFRFEELQRVLTVPQPAAVIWGNLIFSALSLAAPIWLGWVATKQINQRFKLSEDYGFKASVASAYEAWKSEAKKQDKEFEKRLFGTALSRLEEAPLRFIETENYGSPWHELTSSPAFAKALEKMPELQATVAKIISGAGGAAAGAAAVISTMMPGTRAGAEKPDVEPPS